MENIDGFFTGLIILTVMIALFIGLITLMMKISDKMFREIVRKAGKEVEDNE